MTSLCVLFTLTFQEARWILRNIFKFYLKISATVLEDYSLCFIFWRLNINEINSDGCCQIHGYRGDLA